MRQGKHKKKQRLKNKRVINTNNIFIFYMFSYLVSALPYCVVPINSISSVTSS